MTGAQMRKLALSMPEAEEKSHFGNPDFRVRNKIFAGLSADETRATLKLLPEIQSVVLATDSSVFSPCAGAWGRSGWTFVDLLKAERGQVEQLVREAWTLVAPKNLVASSEGASASRPTGKPLRAKRSRK